MALMTRRECLRKSLLAVAGTGVAAMVPRSARGQVVGANDVIRVGMAGLRLRGTELIDWFRKVPGVRIVALCDCDTQFFERHLKTLGDTPDKVATVQDFRRLLDDKNLDAVVIATPNHWHALMTVWACQAGKDVYVEKPISHNIREGRQMVAAASKYNRIVQSGTQNRSDVGLKAAAQFLRGGGLGAIRLARVFDLAQRQPIGKTEGPQPVPPTANYDLFQGPAPLVPLRRKNLHYDWHFVWATGSGDCGNRGVHCLDHARWMTGRETLPERVLTIAGRLGWDDDGETPNAHVTFFDCQPVPILYELTNLVPDKPAKPGTGFPCGPTSMKIECQGGTLTGGRGGATAFDTKGKIIQHFKGDSGVTHAANFIAAVRARKPEVLEADVHKGHISSALCHLANVSYLVGQRQPPQKIRDAIRGNAVLGESFERLASLLQANQVDLDKTPLTLGPLLAFDPQKEQFTGEGAEQANAYLSRAYRPPFVVPGNV